MPSSAPLDLPALLETAIDIAKQAGARIKAGSESRFKNATGVDEKKNSVDLVTETDQAVEKFVAESLRAAYPDHQFIGEESYAAGERHDLSDEPTWIVDPIDGTTNFVVGFPFSCISIGLAFEGKPVLGVVYNPFLDQLYSAAKGHGAFFNRTTRLPLVAPPPSMTTISQALIGHEWGSDRSQATMDLKLKAFGNLFGQGEGKAMARGGRSMGSAALNFCAVAAGQLDCYWEIGCWEWDVCAGIAIAEEAGGRCFGGKQSTLSGDDEMNAALVCGRKYFVIRGLPEGGREAQAKLAREFYGYIEEWDQ